MQLIKMVLSNFQGIKSFTFEPNGNAVNVYGTNAAGKTTLYNAYTWLLFDKASTGEKGFSPKTKDSQGNDIHYLDHSVEGIFKREDGSIVTFKKVLHENWQKVRGSIEETFSGHKTEYYKDNIPMLKCDYDSHLAVLFTPMQAQILTQPLYFPETMSWQERRQLLLEVCGTVKDEDVIELNLDKLGDLPSTLLMPGTTDRFYTVDEYRKITAVQCKEINDKITAIPNRIDEAKRAMPDITGINPDVVQASIKAILDEKAALETEKATANNSTAKQAITKEIADLQISNIQNKANYLRSGDSSQGAERARIATMEAALPEHTKKRFDCTLRISVLQSKLETAKKLRENYDAEYKELYHTEWQPKAEFTDTVCPTCGQAIPADTIEAARRKHADAEENERAAFNLNKSSRLESIKNTVTEKCSKAIIADLEKEIAEEQDMLEQIDGCITSLMQTIKEANDNLPKATEWEQTEEFATYTAQLAELQTKLNNEDDSTAEQRKAIQSEIDNAQARLDEQNDRLYKLQTAKTQQARIEELDKEQKQLAKQHGRLQKGLYLCEEFVRLKVSMLDNLINSRFETVKFKLFEDQINGGLKECCEVMVPGESGLVEFRSANNAARICAGLEIMNTLSNYWGISLPVFVDNSESVVNLQPIASQVIRLVVSEQDRELRTEVA